MHFKERLDALLVPHANRLQHIRLRYFRRADLDHVQAVGVAGEHEVQIGELHLGMRGIDDELLAIVGDNPTHADGSHRSLERGIGQAQRRRCCRARNHISVVLSIVTENPRLDLDLVDKSVGEQRPNRTVHHPHREDFFFVGRTLALTKTTGELSAGPELLAVIALKWKKVQSRSRIGPHRGRENRGVSVGGHDRTAGEPGDLPGFDFERSAPDFPLYTNICHRLSTSSRSHPARILRAGHISLRPPTSKRQEANNSPQTLVLAQQDCGLPTAT